MHVFGFELGRAGDYYEHGSYIVTLFLEPGSKPRIRQSSFSQGSSAGSSFGTDKDLFLPKDFYWEYTPEKIADICWGTCYNEIRSNQKLHSFLNKARKRRGYFIDYNKAPHNKGTAGGKASEAKEGDAKAAAGKRSETKA